MQPFLFVEGLVVCAPKAKKLPLGETAFSVL